MKSVNLSEKLKEISQVIAKNGDGISYIHNEDDIYTIGTKKYDKRIAQYLDQTVKTWRGIEADQIILKRKKKRNKESEMIRVGYLWEIPLTENNLLTDSKS